MPVLAFRPESEIRAETEEAFGRHRDSISALLPGAEIVHIGATAIEGSLTKGDVDLLVRVPAEGFDDAVAVLKETYEIHQPENWTTTFASFKDEAPDRVPIGAQVVAQASEDDRTFLALMELLRSRPDLVEEYNELKRRHEGGDEDAYLDEKAAFHERLRPLLDA